MQNKGFVKVFAVLLTLVCVFYLSFSFVTRYHMDKAAQDPKGEAHYLDSMQNEKVYLGSYTLKQCREMEIGLGLDLKGGMSFVKSFISLVVSQSLHYIRYRNFKDNVHTTFQV